MSEAEIYKESMADTSLANFGDNRSSVQLVTNATHMVTFTEIKVCVQEFEVKCVKEVVGSVRYLGIERSM